ncbi:unnamed protein product [Soboliphyme baturini]|uniref:serine--tRNA ligase n=1 Tax=Soboliphyme baturini TaxID=241478 RepID=A0A183J2I8_9BILA|nr:unnamed protein product [Soboliphyme baturini]
MNGGAVLKLFFSRRALSTRCLPRIPAVSVRPELDFDYLLDKNRLAEIRVNIERRKQVGDIDEVHRLWDTLYPFVLGRQDHVDEMQLQDIWNAFYAEALKIPNRSHPDVPVGPKCNAKTVFVHGEKRMMNFKVRKAEELAIKFRLLRSDVAQCCSDKAYFLLSQLAIIERTLVRIVVNRLLKKGFQLITVPDIIGSEIAMKCGLMNRSEKNIAYTLKKYPDYCLSGTAEMGISSFLQGQMFRLEELPRRYVAQSRCFRPEAASGNLTSGLYRVHEFTKVEMFGVTADETGNESDIMLEELVEFQKDFFTSLNLHFRVMDMPSQELGAPAYRKFDIEAWMPGRKSYGEVRGTNMNAFRCFSCVNASSM